jgi:penicillin-binding protein 2
VDFSFISLVKEEGLDGVNIVATTQRSYNTDYAGVLLGQVGAISAERWAENKETFLGNGYAMDSIIGLSGMEAAFEEYLRGTDGQVKITRDIDGNVVSETYVTEPVAGCNVTTTLDIGLQGAAEEALAKYTDEINYGAGGSAAVVIDIHTGEVLAAASYPTFSAATYLENYQALAEDERLPLYDRALLGTYAPGSTYKICSATAGLSSGAITTSTTFDCHYTFQYYDWEYHCWYRAGHNSEDVRAAIRDSCNVFFYNLADLVGISTLTDYAQQYGLGLSTGIELSESTGVNAGPEYSASIGGDWQLGNALSASIGQSDNRFTVLQLANYIATFINGGDHYSAHLLKTVKSNDNSQIMEEYEPTVLNHVELSEAGYNAIKTGMGEVIDADKITDFDTLRSWGIDVGCKTGTAQIGRTGLYNGLFVSFAPYDDPEIAICTVVEKAPNGASTSAITAAIMEYYFSPEADLERVSTENTLIH